MELTKSFPPADDLVTKLSAIDYQKHFNKYMDIVETVVLYVAAIATVLWDKFQTVKITTPDIISEYFYFNFNMRREFGDEFIGVSVGNRYFGIYDNSAQWGILDENGAL